MSAWSSCSAPLSCTASHYAWQRCRVATARSCPCSEILDELEEPAESSEVRLKIKAEDFKTVADNTIAAFQAWLGDGAGSTWEADEPNYEGVRVKVRSTSLWLLSFWAVARRRFWR